MRVLCLLFVLLLASPLPVHCGFVFVLPNQHGFSDEHFGMPVDQLLRNAIKVYNHSELIVSVPNDWEHMSAVKDYIRQKEEKRSHSKRSGTENDDELWQQVHLNYDRRQRWLHDDDFTDDVMAYVSDLEDATTNSWGLDRIDQQQLTSGAPLDGQYLGFDETVSDQRTVHFYVIDTGVATHPAIPQTISYDFTYYPDDPADCNGHGTHVAGIAMSVGMGVSPGSRHIIHSIKVLDCFGMGDTTGVLAGLSWVKANFQSPAVINLSIGIKGISSSLSTMIKSMRALGIVIVGASGNQGDNACLYFPAGITSSGDIPVVGVGALQMPTGLADMSASFSNWGACVRVYAPGDKIQSTLPGGLVGKKSGTSMASPFVAGAIIIALATTPSLTAVEAQALVLGRATMGTVNGANVASGTNNVLWVPPALNQPVIPPALATSTTSVASSTTRASTTNNVLASTTSTARATSLSGTTTAARTTSTRATTSATTALASTARATSTSTTRASTTGRASTTSTTRASTTAATSTRASTSRATSTAATSTKATSTHAASTTSTTARATTSTTSAARTTSARSTSVASTSTKATSTHATSTASTTARATTSTTSAARTTSARSTSTASTSTRSTSTRASTSTTSTARATTTGLTSTRAASTRATTTGVASTRGATTSTVAATTSAVRASTTGVTSTRAASTRGTTTAATLAHTTSTASTRAVTTAATLAHSTSTASVRASTTAAAT